MPDSTARKLEPLRVLLESIIFVWWYRFRYLKCLSIPTLVLVVIWALNVVFQNDSTSLSNWTFWILYQIGFVFFAIACHRLVLLDDSNLTISSIFNKRVAKFLFWFLGAAVFSLTVTSIILNLVLNFPNAASLFKDPSIFYWIQALATIPAFYVIGRFVLIFPATAVDAAGGLRQSWIHTKGYGWKIVVVIGIYPWLISVLIWIVAGDGPNLFNQVFTALLFYVGVALEITALSFIYTTLIPKAENNAEYV